ncbi:MAG: hypothetical protein WD187_00245 [Candidatus Woykebacteria bacterium]
MTIDPLTVQIAVICDRIVSTICHWLPYLEVEVLEVVKPKRFGEPTYIIVKVKFGLPGEEMRDETVVTMTVPSRYLIETVEVKGKRYFIRHITDDWTGPNAPFGPTAGMVKLEEVTW